MSPVKKEEAHHILAEILAAIGQLELTRTQFETSSNQITALNDHSFTNPSTCALTKVQLSGQKINVPKELIVRTQEIETLGHEIDKLAVRVSHGDPDYDVADKSGQILSYMHADNWFRPPMMDVWDDVLKFEDCLRVHSNNACCYQLFYAEVRHRNNALTNVQKTTEDRVSKIQLTGKPEDADTIKNLVKDVVQALSLQSARIHQLNQKAHTILPVHKRTESCRSPQAAAAVANHRNRELQFLKGEDLILEDTTDDLLWRVRVRDGSTSLVPALLVLISGPDPDAINAAKALATKMGDIWNWALKNLGCLLLECLRRLLTQWHQNPSNYESLSKSQGELFVDILTRSKDVIKPWDGTQIHKDLIKLIDDAVNKIKNACGLGYGKGRGAGGPGGAGPGKDSQLGMSKQDVKDFGNEIVYYAELTGYYDDLDAARRKYRQLLGLGDDDQFDMDTDQMLEYVRQNFASEVMMEHTVESAESEDVTRSEQQQQQRLVISSIVDPRDGSSELELDEAIDAGILNMEEGLYINPRTRATKTIQEAMAEGLIQVTAKNVELSEEKVSSFGLIKLTTVRETRPYTITGVVDSQTDDTITLSEAQLKGIIDRASTEYRDKALKTTMPIRDAIDVGLVKVDYKNGQQEGQSETVVKTYAVHAVVDVERKRRLSFAEAVNRGILDKERGIYRDTKTETDMTIGEAIQKGFVKARRVEDDESLDMDAENAEVAARAGKALSKLKAVRAMGALQDN